MDRDHFMDEFFEQVKPPIALAQNAPSQQLPLPCAPPLSCTLLGLLGLAHFVEPWLVVLIPSPGPPTGVRGH